MGQSSHQSYQSYQVGGSKGALHSDNSSCGTDLPTNRLASSYSALATVMSRVFLDETENAPMSLPSITSSNPECEQDSDPPPGNDSDVSSSLVLDETENVLSRPPIISSNPECEQNSDPPPGNDLEALPFKRRVSFLPFGARAMDIPKIDIRDMHLCFYSLEDVAQFRHDKWVEDNRFDPDVLHETGGGLETNSSTSSRRVSFSAANVETHWIPRIQDLGLCFYNADDFAEFCLEEWVEQCSGDMDMESGGGGFKAFYSSSPCWLSPPIISSNPECEKDSDPPPSNDLESLPFKRRVSFLPFKRRVSFLPFGARVMEIPQIDPRDVHLCFYSHEDIARFRHDKWVEEHGFDPDDDSHETSVQEETPMDICLKTDSSTRQVSFSDNVKTLWIPRVQESEWDLCFYNSNDLAEFRNAYWVEQCNNMESSEGLFKASSSSSCWKDRERDDEEMTDSTHSISQSSFEDDDLNDVQVVLLENSFNKGEYQDSSSNSSRVSFSDDIQVKYFTKVGPSEWGNCYYEADELSDFRHAAWVEQCARHTMERDWIYE